MHFSLLEKLGASVLVCAWLIYGTNFLGDVLVHVPEGSSHAAVPAAAEKKPEAAAQSAQPTVDFNQLLAAADPAAGEKVFAKCKSCHTAEAGGGNKVGPNLHGVVGRPVATAPGFAYSPALSGLGGNWTEDRLNTFLEKPAAYASGTKMTFAGLSKAEDRAAIIAWLKKEGGTQ